MDVMEPTIQYGFAGFAFTLLGIIVWLIKRLLRTIADSNTVISGNTEALRAIHGTADETRRWMADIRDQLLQRPCLMKED